LRNEQNVSEQDEQDEQEEQDELDELDERDEPDVLEFEKIFKMSPSSRPYHNQEGVLNNDCDGALSARSVKHCASVLVRVLCNM
jgi:hypothetical protein